LTYGKSRKSVDVVHDNQSDLYDITAAAHKKVEIWHWIQRPFSAKTGALALLRGERVRGGSWKHSKNHPRAEARCSGTEVRVVLLYGIFMYLSIVYELMGEFGMNLFWRFFQCPDVSERRRLLQVIT
jgi:hypothetical protein